MTHTDEKLIADAKARIEWGLSMQARSQGRDAGVSDDERMIRRLASRLEQALSTGPAHDAGVIEAKARVGAFLQPKVGTYTTRVLLVYEEGDDMLFTTAERRLFADLRLILQALAGGGGKPRDPNWDWHTAINAVYEANRAIPAAAPSLPQPAGGRPDDALTILAEIETDLRGHGNTIYRGEPRAATAYFRRANAVQDVLAYLATQSAQLARMAAVVEACAPVLALYGEGTLLDQRDNCGDYYPSAALEERFKALSDAFAAARAILEMGG